MSPFTSLLESLHSSLIDELNAQYPKLKPELGLPSRQSAWAPPPGQVSEMTLGDVELGTARGIYVIAGPESQALWKAVLKRAGDEFHRRGISPKLGGPVTIAAPHLLPSGFQGPTRLIWIPVTVNGQKLFLGIGA